MSNRFNREKTLVAENTAGGAVLLPSSRTGETKRHVSQEHDAPSPSTPMHSTQLNPGHMIPHQHEVSFIPNSNVSNKDANNPEGFAFIDQYMESPYPANQTLMSAEEPDSISKISKDLQNLETYLEWFGTHFHTERNWEAKLTEVEKHLKEQIRNIEGRVLDVNHAPLISAALGLRTKLKSHADVWRQRIQEQDSSRSVLYSDSKLTIIEGNSPLSIPSSMIHNNLMLAEQSIPMPSSEFLNVDMLEDNLPVITVTAQGTHSPMMGTTEIKVSTAQQAGSEAVQALTSIPNTPMDSEEPSPAKITVVNPASPKVKMPGGPTPSLPYNLTNLHAQAQGNPSEGFAPREPTVIYEYDVDTHVQQYTVAHQPQSGVPLSVEIRKTSCMPEGDVSRESVGISGDPEENEYS